MALDIHTGRQVAVGVRTSFLVFENSLLVLGVRTSFLAAHTGHLLTVTIRTNFVVTLHLETGLSNVGVHLETEPRGYRDPDKLPRCCKNQEGTPRAFSCWDNG